MIYTPKSLLCLFALFIVAGQADETRRVGQSCLLFPGGPFLSGWSTSNQTIPGVTQVDLSDSALGVHKVSSGWSICHKNPWADTTIIDI